MSPAETLAALHRMEFNLGRIRTIANAARTIDLDLIAHGRFVLDRTDLVIPHPRAADRLFVMAPLAEIAPDWLHPVLLKSAEELAMTASIGADCHRISEAVT